MRGRIRRARLISVARGPEDAPFSSSDWSERRPAGHRSEFTHDGLDRRVRIVEKDSGATTRDAHLIWDGTEIAEERLSTAEVNRFFTDRESHNGVARYLTRDHLGGIREVTDASGAVVTRNDYDP